MLLESLNIWGGRVGKPLLEHIEHQGSTVDIFCFQEVFHNATNVRPVHEKAVKDIFLRIDNVLPDHTGYFSPHQTNEEGLAIFVKKNIPLIEEGHGFVHRWRDAMVDGDSKTLGRNMQYIHFRNDDNDYTVANMHGLWNGQGKTDTPERIAQSEKARKLLDKRKGRKILCGDFNLLPETESMGILEKGMRNLVKDYKVSSTRSKLYAKEGKFADYILISPEITVVDFKVMETTVSDHLPLVLEFQ